jgi:hypothetical protein
MANCQFRNVVDAPACLPMREVIRVADQKARQSAKIRQIGETLIAEGYHGLNEQAKALGLPRSTTWTILRGTHKASGLSVAIINRMLASPAIPPRVRLTIFEYIQEKRAGLYGDCKQSVRSFTAHLEGGQQFLDSGRRAS